MDSITNKDAGVQYRKEELIHRVADFLRKVLPYSTSQNASISPQNRSVRYRTQTPQTTQRSSIATQVESTENSFVILFTSSISQITYVFEKPKRRGCCSVEIEEDDDDHDNYETINENVLDFGRRHFCEIASPYLTAYLYNRQFIYKPYPKRWRYVYDW